MVFGRSDAWDVRVSRLGRGVELVRRGGGDQGVSTPGRRSRLRLVERPDGGHPRGPVRSERKIGRFLSPAGRVDARLPMSAEEVDEAGRRD